MPCDVVSRRQSPGNVSECRIVPAGKRFDNSFTAATSAAMEIMELLSLTIPDVNAKTPVKIIASSH